MTAAFTYKVPLSAVGGDYLLKAYNSYSVAPALRKIRIRDYPRSQLEVTVTLPLESYRPGDTVSGSVQVNTIDGSAFDNPPTFDLSVSFDSSALDGTSVSTLL